MKNLTISLDDRTYREARSKAAAEDRSLSAVVREFLGRYVAGVDWEEHVARRNEAMNRLLEETRHFRAGEMPSRDERHER
ncbi:MAG: hypothetical protein HKN82_18270 [Akkermansiaceae bacterium]|nr:hypothetical protein [Akkermansiaceae bacterium]NNM29026.1 hypothetical protein [Akkermansiaceae bacterium]